MRTPLAFGSGPGAPRAEGNLPRFPSVTSLPPIMASLRQLFPFAAAAIFAAAAGTCHAGEAVQAFQELFAQSQKDKRGLTFYVKGQSIPGVVTRVIGNEAVEVRNQTHGRIVIRIDSIDAVAAN